MSAAKKTEAALEAARVKAWRAWEAARDELVRAREAERAAKAKGGKL